MPTLNQGVIASYKDSITSVRNVVNTLAYMSPQFFPILKRIGGGTPEAPKLRSLDTESGTVHADKLEWEDTILRPFKFVLNGAMTNVQTTIDSTPTSDRPHFVKGLVLQVDDEQMLVTVAGLSGTPPTITRGWGGTTAVTHLTAAPIEVVTRVHEQGTTVDVDPFVTPDMPFNYWQEIAEGYSISEAEMQIERYLRNPDGYRNLKLFEAMKACYTVLERGILLGKRVAGVAGTPSAIGGLDTFIDSANFTNKAAAAVATSDINNLMRLIFETTGTVPNALWTSGYGKVALSNLYSNPTNLNINRDQGDKRAGAPVGFIDTDFGPLEVVTSPFIPQKNMWFIAEDMLGVGPLGELDFAEKELATDGTYQRFKVSGNYTFQMRASKCHGKIFNFA